MYNLKYQIESNTGHQLLKLHLSSKRYVTMTQLWLKPLQQLQHQQQQQKQQQVTEDLNNLTNFLECQS